MFEKLSIPDAKKGNLESPKSGREHTDAADESSLLCAGLMLAALAMPALSGVAEASESVTVPNIEYVISNDDMPAMELEFISSPTVNTTAVASIDGQQKEQTKSGGWVKTVVALASAIAKIFGRSSESEDEEDS